MADKTTGDLQAVPVGDLPLAPDIYDDTLIPVEQNGEAKSMTGAQWKAYGVAAAKKEADKALEASIHQPIIQNGTWWIWDAEKVEYADTGETAQGGPGTTPHIGNNGNWWIGETDTGVSASGGGDTGNVSSTDIDTIVVLDQEKFDALPSRPSTTFYAIRG